jgi:hypothetical protein
MTSESNGALPDGTRIIGYIDYDFFNLERTEGWNMFNASPAKAGAFTVQAFGSGEDGNCLRPPEYIFFGPGLYSLAFMDPMIRMQSIHVGYEASFRKKGKCWEVSCPKNTKEYIRGETISIPKLRVSKYKPNGKGVIILSGIECKNGQFFYLQ